MSDLGLSIFEELRFIIELGLVTYASFFIVFPKKSRFSLRFIPFYSLICLIATSYSFFYKDLFSSVGNDAFTIVFSVFWYMFLTFLTMLLAIFSFEVKFNDALLFTLGGYAVQHICYVLVNEIVRFLIYPDIVGSFISYFSLCLGSCLLFYPPYLYLIKRYRKHRSSVMDSKKSTTALLSSIGVLLYASSYFFQSFFRNAGEATFSLVSAIADLFVSLMIAFVTVLLEKGYVDKRERDFVEALYKKEKEQYEIFKGSVEYINVKCHDLKHEMKKLYEKGAISSSTYDEMEKSIKAYEANIHTGKEEVDIILSDLASKCLSLKIQFSPLVDGSLLDRFDEYDLYVLLSNIFDNALSYLPKVEEGKRYLSFIVKKMNGMLLIKQANYLNSESDVIFKKDGSLKTSKSDERTHGYGSKSILLFAKKYHGEAKISAKRHEFSILLSFPLSE